MWSWNGIPNVALVAPILMAMFLCMAVMCMMMMHGMKRRARTRRITESPMRTRLPDSERRPSADANSPAFTDYRADTLRRLDQEQREFQEFMAGLRAAKDRAEFDHFIEARRDAGAKRS